MTILSVPLNEIENVSRRFSFVCFSVHGREDCTRTYLLYSSMIMLLQLLAIR